MELTNIGADLDYRDEPLGQKDKSWVQLQDESVWLFKFVRNSDGWYRGEDWAEWCYYELAKSLGIPAADIQPATIDGKRGILSRNIAEKNERLVHGNELLYQAIEGYEKEQGRSNPNYTVASIFDALKSVKASAESHPWEAVSTGFEGLTTYLILDALTAARDRHHANWALLQSDSGYALAPSFDHGNALGFQESGGRIAQILSNPDGVSRWAARGKSPHFAGKPSLVDVALEAIQQCGGAFKDELRFRLAGDHEVLLSEVVATVPDQIMTLEHKQFVTALFRHNRRRINDALK
ncbi:HipA domain-containing protein [Paeniglutamicibacter sp. R2-26]|uniref:HipA domain-containing protein n=1 Tax=Paeniglutamicibacter sp. R2-26 TaxID=3144417 RepID=UPI003EE53F80